MKKSFQCFERRAIYRIVCLQPSCKYPFLWQFHRLGLLIWNIYRMYSFVWGWCSVESQGTEGFIDHSVLRTFVEYLRLQGSESTFQYQCFFLCCFLQFKILVRMKSCTVLNFLENFLFYYLFIYYQQFGRHPVAGTLARNMKIFL